MFETSDAKLAELRRLAKQIKADPDDVACDWDASQIADLFIALDRSIMRGEGLPIDWLVPKAESVRPVRPKVSMFDDM